MAGESNLNYVSPSAAFSILPLFLGIKNTIYSGNGQPDKEASVVYCSLLLVHPSKTPIDIRSNKCG